jgi:hypothetical protein
VHRPDPTSSKVLYEGEVKRSSVVTIIVEGSLGFVNIANTSEPRLVPDSLMLDFASHTTT